MLIYLNLQQSDNCDDEKAMWMNTALYFAYVISKSNDFRLKTDK